MSVREEEKTGINIPGVNATAGLALYDGNMEIYAAVLRSFVHSGYKVLDKMRTVTAETLPDFAISVHGLKSVCAGIGAEKEREAAYKLEIMAKAGDLVGVLTGKDSLVNETECLITGIKAWLGELDSRRSKPLLPRPDRKLLACLKKHCEAYDMNGVDDAMEELERADYESGAALMTWVKEKINESDFSAVASRLSEYMEESE